MHKSADLNIVEAIKSPLLVGEFAGARRFSGLEGVQDNQGIAKAAELSELERHTSFRCKFFGRRHEPIAINAPSCNSWLVVQSIYEKKWVNLPLIAKEGFSTVIGPYKQPFQHIKSLPKSQ